MKRHSHPRPAKSKSWKRLALILLGTATVFGLSSCYSYPNYGHGHHYQGGGYGGGYYGGGYGGGYCR